MRIQPAARASIAIAGLAALCWAYGLAWSYHIPPADLRHQDHRDIPAYEWRTGEIGAAATGEFLTVWAVRDPDPHALGTAYQTNALPAQRLDHAQLPHDVRITNEQAGFASTTFQYQADFPFAARFFWLLFPDAKATVDGQHWETALEPESGLLRLPNLPAGQHTVTVEQVASHAQRWGNGLSMLGVLLAAALAVATVRAAVRRPLLTTPPTREHHRMTGVIWVCVLAAALRWVWLDTLGSPFFRTRLNNPPTTIAGSQAASVNFGNQLQLIGWQPQARSITLYWQAMQPLTADYSTAVFLRTANGETIAQHDNQQPSILPTRFRQPTQYAADLHSFALLPAGKYDVVVAVYAHQPEGGIRNLDVVTPQGLAGYFAVIGILTTH